MTPQAFIALIAPIAVRQAAKHGNKVYASVCIGQAAQETGWGKTKRMTDANALMGVKVGKSAWKFGKAWEGAAYKTGTTEYYDGVNPSEITAWFRQYSSYENCIEDYMDMLCSCKRYKNCLNRNTPEESIRAIVAGGYATGPEYAEHVISNINKYNLKQYDGKQNVQTYTQPKTGNPYSVPTKAVRLNSKGNAVRWLQYALNEKGGYKLLVDGVAGLMTIGAVMAWQREHNLVVDGIAGQKTIQSLLG